MVECLRAWLCLAVSGPEGAGGSQGRTYCVCERACQASARYSVREECWKGGGGLNNVGLNSVRLLNLMWVSIT